MGNCVSFQLSCDQTVNGIFRFLCEKGYIRSLKANLSALRREMKELIAIQHDVQSKVEREERQHLQKLEIVQVWLTEVENINKRFNDLDNTSPVQLQKLCLCGLCSKNVCSSYKYGESVFLLLEEVKNLKLKSTKFDEAVTGPAPISKVEEMPTGPTIGQEEMLEKAWNRIIEDGVGIMGLHGMGGVGKTTLFKKIHNKFSELPYGSFDVVVWIVVSQAATISKIQEDIAQKLHVCDGKWTKKNESDKAIDIHRALKGKRFVLMLDDLWEKVDLEAMGVPFPTKENRCKIAFTTRSREVCGRMGDHTPMQVNCLGRDKAWELFKSKVGDYTLRGDPAIVGLAREVAEKCDGLPLALSVIGETMASKTTIHEWENAIDVLRENAAEFSDMEDKILLILKYSYDNLMGEDIKFCFLYCALFPEDDEIDKEKLIHYCICEGFMGEYKDIRRAMNKGYDILGTLIRKNLLMEVDRKKVVMHDVVREMALWIASSFGKQKENFVVQARAGLREVPKVKNWGAVRRMSLMDNNIEQIISSSNCSELRTLLLQYNDLLNLSGELFQSMQKLLVLDLSGNSSLTILPKEISELASLQYLGLSGTSIKKLPVGVQELKKLTHLNLSNTRSLRRISGISKLSSLRILNLEGSELIVDVILVKELQLLEHLEPITIAKSTVLAFELILGNQKLPVTMENLHKLELEQNSHERQLYSIESSDLYNPPTPCYTNLSTVVIKRCYGIKDLTWLLFAPNLFKLHISNSNVEEIINEEKATNLTGIITPFQNLETLSLDILPELESIYWSPLPFPFLKEIVVSDCPKLRKLPLNATSVPRVGVFEINMYPLSQKADLEWEDEDTKNRFLPLIYWEGAASP